MAKSILDVIIRTLKQGKGDDETVRGLFKLKSAIGSATVTFAALAGAAYTVDKVLDATVGKYVTYGQHVRDASLALGLSADETSRVIALTDDLGISYDELSASIKKNADNTNFSIEGLAAASAEYLALEDSQDRAKYAQERYGKQWAQFAKLLEKGPDQVRAMAAAVDEGHLFDDEDLRRVEEYRVATDQLNDAWEGITMTAGEKIIPVLTDVMNHTLDVQRATEMANEAGVNTLFWLKDEQDKYIALAVAERESAQATSESSAAMQDAAEAAEALAVTYDSLLGLTMDLQNGYDGFAEKERMIRDEMDQITIAVANGEITAEEYNQKMGELSGQLDSNAKAMEDWSKRTVFSLVQARLAAEGGIDAKEFSFLINLGEQMGIIDESTATMAQGVNDSLDAIDLAKPEEFYDLWKDIALLPHEQVFTITTNTVGGGYTYGGESGERAIGGPVEENMPYLVHQDEIIVPNQSGYVLTRTDARQIAALAMGGGGGGRQITIYGGLTVIASGSVTDVMDELG